MLRPPPGIRVFMALEPIDCRKSFDGLTAAALLLGGVRLDALKRKRLVLPESKAG